MLESFPFEENLLILVSSYTTHRGLERVVLAFPFLCPCHFPIHYFHPCTSYLLSAYHVPSTVLGTGIWQKKKDTNSCPHGAYILVVKADNKEITW